MLISANQSKLNKLKFAAKQKETCKYVRYQPITVTRREICKTRHCIRSRHCEGLQELHVSAEERYLEHSYNLFSSQMCFYGFQKTNFLRAGGLSNALKQDNLSQMLLFSSTSMIPLFCNNGNSSKPAKQLSEDLQPVVQGL